MLEGWELRTDLYCRFGWPEIAPCCGRTGRELASLQGRQTPLPREVGVCSGKGEELPSQAVGLGLPLARKMERHFQCSGGAGGQRAEFGVCLVKDKQMHVCIFMEG